MRRERVKIRIVSLFILITFLIQSLSLVSFSAGDTTPPTSPTNLSSTAKTDTTITLAWTLSTDVVGVTGYDIYVNSSSIGTVTGSPVIVSGFSPNTLYNIYVRARDAAGNVSGNSNTISVTTNANADTTAPTAPSNLTSPSKSNTTAKLTWTASTDNVGVTGYNVYNGTTLVATTTGAISVTVTCGLQ